MDKIMSEYQVFVNNIEVFTDNQLSAVIPVIVQQYASSGSFRQIRVNVSYMNVVVSTLQVKNNHGLILYNNECNIKVSTIFPNYSCFDKLTISECKRDNIHVEKKPMSVPEPEPIISKTRSSEPTPVIINFVKYDANCSERRSQYAAGVLDTESQLRIFSSDKISYLKIKNDIIHNVISEPADFFVVKYEIFSALEEIGEINFYSDVDLSTEYEKFNELFVDVMSNDELIIGKDNDECSTGELDASWKKIFD